ncbi:hypothetical protein JXR93_14550 [bacterium]|nr:hypothetical protein [bacterium]
MKFLVLMLLGVLIFTNTAFAHESKETETKILTWSELSNKEKALLIVQRVMQEVMV